MENKAINDFKAIRVRTWTLTLLILVVLTLYYFVNVAISGEPNIIDLIVLATASTIIHFIYYPDGKLRGAQDDRFISNRDCYNDKASEINKNSKISCLREYCKHDYEQRRRQYIEIECGKIGITIDEYEALKNEPKKRLKSTDTLELDGRLIFLSRMQRKRLIRLIFGVSPIEYNTPETIMSSVYNNGYSAIKDMSVKYELHAHIRKVIMAFVVGVVLSYITYTVEGEFDFATIVKISMFILSIVSSAVLSFNSGETSIKTYKTEFFIELINFIDGFNEWDKSQKDAL